MSDRKHTNIYRKFIRYCDFGAWPFARVVTLPLQGGKNNSSVDNDTRERISKTFGCFIRTLYDICLTSADYLEYLKIYTVPSLQHSASNGLHYQALINEPLQMAPDRFFRSMRFAWGAASQQDVNLEVSVSKDPEKWLRNILNTTDFERIDLTNLRVPSQEYPDPRFTTCCIRCGKEKSDADEWTIARALFSTGKKAPEATYAK